MTHASESGVILNTINSGVGVIDNSPVGFTVKKIKKSCDSRKQVASGR